MYVYVCMYVCMDTSCVDTDIEEIDLNPQNAIKLSSSPPRNLGKKGIIYYMDMFMYICMYMYVCICMYVYVCVHR
jgi:hypothetical protein